MNLNRQNRKIISEVFIAASRNDFLLEKVDTFDERHLLAIGDCGAYPAYTKLLIRLIQLLKESV